ncbi:MAG: hypothetical protein WCD86_25710 [Ktedonobacteraceae bacterium]
MSDDTAKDQTRAQYESICEMVAALDADYDRLDELNEIVAEHTKADTTCDTETLREWEELNAQAGDCENQDAACDRIQEDPLSVQVRSGWYSPGDEAPPPEEFEILLCTGGPAVRIRGELDERGQPIKAWIEYSDWGTPWTQYFDVEQDVLLRYCEQFYFSD